MTRTRTTSATLAVLGLVLASCGSGSDRRADEIELDEPPVIVVDDEPSVAASDATDDADPPEVTDHGDAAAALFDEAVAALTTGDCDTAIAGFDAVLDDPAWRGDDDEVARLRAECVVFQEIVLMEDPVERFAELLWFTEDGARRELFEHVDELAAGLAAEFGAALLTPLTCDLLDDDYGRMAPLSIEATKMGCATVYADAERADDATELAIDVLGSATDADTVDRALAIVRADDGTCASLAVGSTYVDPVTWPDRHALMLQECMTTALAAEELGELTRLQIAFLTSLPDHAGAADVTTALLDEPAACGWIEEMPAGLQATKTFKCAQVAEYVGDVDTAIDRYQDFVDRYPDDPLATEATIGLARTLIFRARLGETTALPQPERVGGLGGSTALVSFSNDTRYEQRLVFLGPEALVIDVAASEISSTYSERPGQCLDGVPTVEIELAPGTYEVLQLDSPSDPQIGTWELRAGSGYGWCSFYVRV